MSFTVVIAGRPNVGKSTLFNRLVGKQMALVSDEPGVTRDWREGDGHLFDLEFRAIDTAGLESLRGKGTLSARTAQRTKTALARANAILLVVDARAGITAEDEAIAREIRKTGKPIILLANKCESAILPSAMDEAVSLGFGDPLPISAAHGDGMMDLHQELLKFAPPESEEEAVEDEEKSLILAIVGRPNAGKSTLINKLIGEDRVLTGPEPGLTRDAIPIAWRHGGKPVRLVDTAGMRRRARVTETLERMSVQETLRAIRLAHIAILVLDATQPFDKQDLIIARHIVEEGRVLIVALNKWDLVEDKKLITRQILEKAKVSLAQAENVPLVPVCAVSGDGLETLIKEAMRLYDKWNLRISTGKLNRWLQDMEESHPPPIVGGRRIKLRYVTQIKSRPPSFSLWVNKPVDLPESYLRFLTHGLRKTFDLPGIPIRWQVKKSENPYEEKKKKK
ncbi:MAG: ribosome biogenesis GTPase Der [Alphaproteobacteria bacterium]|nr:ribosome biogenesis GTPase Der [Alphaproteobacteria bacterium]